MFTWIVDRAVNFIIGWKFCTAYFPVVFLLRKEVCHFFVLFGIFWDAIWHILSLWTWQHCTGQRCGDRCCCVTKWRIPVLRFSLSLYVKDNWLVTVRSALKLYCLFMFYLCLMWDKRMIVWTNLLECTVPVLDSDWDCIVSRPSPYCPAGVVVQVAGTVLFTLDTTALC